MRATKFSLIAVSISLFVLAAGRVANADMITLTATEIGGMGGTTTNSANAILGVAVTQIPDTYPAPTSVGDFTVAAQASLVETAAQSNIATTTLFLTNNSSSSETIKIDTVGMLSVPVGDVAVHTDLTATDLGSPATASAYGYLNSSDTNTVTLMNLLPATAGHQDTATISVPGVTAPFTLGDTLTVTLAGGESGNLSVQTFAVATPEPSRVVGLLGLALMGGTGLCFSSARKRKLAIC